MTLIKTDRKGSDNVSDAEQIKIENRVVKYTVIAHPLAQTYSLKTQ